MAEPISKALTRIQDWPGQVSNTGPMGSPNQPGQAEVQTNLAVNIEGEMAARPGYTKVQFDSEG